MGLTTRQKERYGLRNLVIKPRSPEFDIPDIEDMGKQRMSLQREVLRITQEMGLPEKKIMIPAFKIKLRRYIKENLSYYIPRLR